MDSSNKTASTKLTRLTRGPKTIAIMYFCLAFLYVLWAGFKFLGGLPWAGIQGGLGMFENFGGLADLVVSLLLVVVGLGLLRYKNWARIIAITIPVIAYLSPIYLPDRFQTSIFVIGVLGLIPAIYLLSSHKVKVDFKTRN